MSALTPPTSTTPTHTPMSMSVFFATDGGTRCPLCGRFAKQEHLGNLSFKIPNGYVSLYGHLTGYGCNKGHRALPKSKPQQEP